MKAITNACQVYNQILKDNQIDIIEKDVEFIKNNALAKEEDPEEVKENMAIVKETLEKLKE